MPRNFSLLAFGLLFATACKAQSPPTPPSDGIASEPAAIDFAGRAIQVLGGHAIVDSFGALRVDVSSKTGAGSERHQAWSSDWTQDSFRMLQRNASSERNQVSTTSASSQRSTAQAVRKGMSSSSTDLLRMLTYESPAHALSTALGRQQCRVKFGTGTERGLPSIFTADSVRLVWLNCPHLERPAEVWLWAFSKQSALPVAVWGPLSLGGGGQTEEIVVYDSFAPIQQVQMPVQIHRKSQFAPEEVLTLSGQQLLSVLPNDSTLLR